MKKLLGQFFLFICLLMSAPAFSNEMFPLEKSGKGSSAFDALWKAEQKLEADGKPQSAYAAVQDILAKALAEGQQGQALSARLRAAALHQEWAPDSFFTDVADLEALRSREGSPEARAVYASILAEIYESNRHRTQASGLALKSDEMKEWTREQYDSAAAENWRLSVADIPLLSAARSRDWLPFVKQVEHSSYFQHDLLHILWQRVRDRRQGLWENDQLKTIATAVQGEYERLGNREATLLLALDRYDLSSRRGSRQIGKSGVEIAPLLELKDTYASLPLCTEVYLRLLHADNDDIADAQKVAWAEEAIRRYPRYDRIGEVKNLLNELRRPSVKWKGNETYYPGKTYTWHLTSQNATGVEIEVYRLRDDFKEEQMQKTVNAKKISIGDYLRRNGKLVQKLTPTLHSGKPYEEIEDSITWTAPEVGHYALLYSATTDEKEAIKRTVGNQYQLFRVTTLKTLTRFPVDNQVEVIVVDAESGQPAQNALVSLYSRNPRSENRSLMATQKVNEEGRALFNDLDKYNQRLSIEVALADDHYLPEEMLWNRGSSWRDQEQETIKLHLYTDRAIYRPGQTVHLGGIAYSQVHWDAHTMANRTYELRLRDANWKEIATASVTTDSLGVFSADFVLPEGGLPGLYRIQTEGAMADFRVEEYKRPTFEVTFDDVPALQWPQDSIELTGKAMAYTGVPVRQAQVTGTYQFTYPYYWWFRHDDSPQLPIDTVFTDEMGVFRIRIPLRDIPEEALRYGLLLRMNAFVLSNAGETREGNITVPLCTTPLRLNISMQEQQDRDRLKAPVFSLLSSTGKPVEGDICCQILPVGSEEYVAKDLTPSSLMDALRALPSGDYMLRATAQAGRDTASANAHFYLFSMNDKRLPRKTESWLYCPTDTFDAQHPARIQVGSSFEDVALYYSLVAKNGIVVDKLLHISDELQILEIPYLPEYGDGVTVHFAFVKGGKCYTMNHSLRLTLPDKELRWEWTSFRDHLHPGDKETWTLRLTSPDGTPVGANLMATLYDASLDQLVPHDWNLLVNRYHQLHYLPWRSQDYFAHGSANEHLYFSMKDYRSKTLSFDHFDETWLNGLAFYSVMALGSKRLMKAARPTSYEALPNAMQLEGKIAGLNVNASLADEDAAMDALAEESVAESAAEDVNIGDGALASPSSVVRTNFNETAAFFSCLHSDPATGEVTLSFTLPESLTTWQLFGVAHTADMMTTNIQAQTVARKELMARLYLPRFLRAGDRSSLRATVQNLTDEALSGSAMIEVFDPATDKVILSKKVTFATEANSETVLAFDYTPTEDYPVVAVRFTASTSPNEKSKRKQNSRAPKGQFSDGEQHYLPILSAKEWITESVEIQADGQGTFTTDLSSLFNNDSPSATQRRLTVEYTTHPIWNVVQALPALRESQYEDVLSLTSVLYSNVLSSHIAATTPKLKAMIELWKRQSFSEALQSPLTRDEELKQIILNETPWLREADNDNERRAQLIDLFNENLLESRVMSSLDKLAQRQEPDGGFAWYPGMQSSELMTRVVGIELTRLRSLTDNFATLTDDARESANRILQRAFGYIAQANAKAIQEMKKAEAKGATINTGSLMHLHYVYISQRAGVHLNQSQRADVRYLLDHLKGSVAGMSNDERAMAAIVLKADGRANESRLYFDSMKEHLTTTKNHGTFFDYAGGSFTPTGHKVVVHTAAMEAVADLAENDKELSKGLRRWLLQQKRTQMWESSICTVDAIYAMLHGAAALDDIKNTTTDQLTLNFGKKRVVVENAVPMSAPAGLGYIKETYTDGGAPRSISVKRQHSTEAWGAVYAQYLTPISEATAHAMGLTIRRELNSTNLHLGDKLVTRYVISADRDYEYVCLRADRAAAAEPIQQISGYHYSGGLGYYRAVRDAHTDYFFDRLPKGTYVLEETAYTDRTGSYTTGLTTIRCLYAPEYTANTNAVELTIE